MIDEINKLFTEFKLDNLSEATLQVDTEKLTSGEKVLERLKSFEPEEGWICCNDKVFACVSGGNRIESSEALILDAGFDWTDVAGRSILSAELIKGTKSVHLRQDDHGWSIFSFSESPGKEHWFKESVFASRRAPDLVYHVYWRLAEHDGRPVREPWTARFAGFRKGGRK